MLALANLKEVRVVGDGNCGFYAYLAAEGKLEHSQRARLSTPSAADYVQQQRLRERCVRWLEHDFASASHYLLCTEKQAESSSWAPANIATLKNGKERPGDPMGVYANEPALRAMAGLAHRNLVVITSNSGSNIEKPEFRHQPFDKVTVYLPGIPRKGTATVAKFKSWACDVVPALLDPKRASQYRVIVHNGDKPGSITGHFDSTEKI